MRKITIYQGRTEELLKGFPSNYFDSCICDPPYELGFMGKKWDFTGIAYSVEMWREVLRVLKPGVHLLAFGGSRTYHRMACAVEDAGFEIRDQIMWLYGSGFPKSLNVSKAIDKAAGAEREVMGKKTGRAGDQKQDIRGGNFVHSPTTRVDCSDLTAPATDLARQWAGWGTALKPAHEPIVVARKPLEGTVVENVLKWGAGAINVDGCRLENNQRLPGNKIEKENKKNICYGNMKTNFQDYKKRVEDGMGRWPANVIHDGSEEVMAAFPKESSMTGKRRNKNRIQQERQSTPFTRGKEAPEYTDCGSPDRFFYCAKASPAERNAGLEFFPEIDFSGGGGIAHPKADAYGALKRGQNIHPTVKPLALMRYLVRLVTPPGGTVLDPFMGSGSTLIAAAQEGFDAVGIDLEAVYLDITEARVRGNLGMLAEVMRGN